MSPMPAPAGEIFFTTCCKTKAGFSGMWKPLILYDRKKGKRVRRKQHTEAIHFVQLCRNPKIKSVESVICF